MASYDAARTQSVITIDALTKRYGGFTAVDNVSFTALPGRVTGFRGPNGAGKSTTMRIMVGLTAPTAGSVTISGRRFADLPNPGLEVTFVRRTDSAELHLHVNEGDRP